VLFFCLSLLSPVPVSGAAATITYYDTDGYTVLGTQTVSTGDAALSPPSGYSGDVWTFNDGSTVAVGPWNSTIPVSGDLSLVRYTGTASRLLFTTHLSYANPAYGGEWTNYDIAQNPISANPASFYIPAGAQIYLPNADFSTPVYAIINGVTVPTGEVVKYWTNIYGGTYTGSNPSVGDIPSDQLFTPGERIQSGSGYDQYAVAQYGQPEYSVTFRVENGTFDGGQTADIVVDGIPKDATWEDFVKPSVPTADDIPGMVPVWSVDTASLPDDPNDVDPGTPVDSDIVYTLTYVPKTALTLTAGSASFTYDGASHTVSGYAITEGGLRSGDTLYYDGVPYGGENEAPAAARRLTGSTPLVLDPANIRIEDTRGVDVTQFYSLDLVDGGVTVIPRNLTLQVGSAGAVYAGSPLTANLTVTDVSSGRDTGLAAGDTIYPGIVTVTADGPTVIKAGGSFRVFAGGEDVTDQYRITVLPGTFTVTAASAPIPDTGDSPLPLAPLAASAACLAAMPALRRRAQTKRGARNV